MAKKESKPTKRSKRRTDTKKPKSRLKKYKSFRLQKKIDVEEAEVQSVWRTVADAYWLLASRPKTIAWAVLIYGIIYFLFLRAIEQFSVVETRDILETIYLTPDPFIDNLTVSAFVLSTTFGVEVGFVGAIGLFATIIASLALIYIFRRIVADKAVSVRDAYYFGGGQVVPFGLLVSLVVLQLIPFALGAILFTAVTQAQIVVGIGEHMIFIAIWGSLSLLSAYWITNSMLSLYAVSLPGMYPIKALDGTAQFIHNRRLIVFRKIAFILAVLLIFNYSLILLSVWLWPGGAFIFRDIGAVLSLPVYHSYMYSLYRSLI